jgi:hypothetical protein
MTVILGLSWPGSERAAPVLATNRMVVSASADRLNPQLLDSTNRVALDVASSNPGSSLDQPVATDLSAASISLVSHA